MAIRDELHSLLDQLPDDKLQAARPFLVGLLKSRETSPEIEQARQRTHEFKKMVERRFRETRKPGTISSLFGGGHIFPRQGKGFSNHAFHYWDHEALVYQSLNVFDGHELEAVERISLSGDGRTLLYEQELCCGGLTKKHENRFPLAPQSADEGSNPST
jgi:hypothetical protein